MQGMDSYTQAAIGAGDESTGSDVEAMSLEDHLVANGRNPGHQRSHMLAGETGSEEFGF
jgi:hypothetical protein